MIYPFKLILAIILICTIISCFTSCSKDKFFAHACPFKNCPYKGIEQYTGVINTGETTVDKDQDFTDTYYIDLLHIQYPSKSYDELEEMLFN